MSQEPFNDWRVTCILEHVLNAPLQCVLPMGTDVCFEALTECALSTPGNSAPLVMIAHMEMSEQFGRPCI